MTTKYLLFSVSNTPKILQVHRTGTFNGKASKEYIMQGKHQNLNN